MVREQAKAYNINIDVLMLSLFFSGEKPYKCNICNKAFGYNHVLKLHQVSHFGEKVP